MDTQYTSERFPRSDSVRLRRQEQSAFPAQGPRLRLVKSRSLRESPLSISTKLQESIPSTMVFMPSWALLMTPAVLLIDCLFSISHRLGFHTSQITCINKP